ncbi:hypothetical protein [Streptomyces griseoruber]
MLTHTEVARRQTITLHGQPVAVVMATTPETAQHAASLVGVSYDAEPPSTDMSVADPAGDGQTYARGDAEGALGSSAVRLEMTYQTARIITSRSNRPASSPAGTATG